jgi:hypothetical protein
MARLLRTVCGEFEAGQAEPEPCLSYERSGYSARQRFPERRQRSDLGHPSDWCLLTPCQGRRQAWLRVYMYRAALPSAVVLRSQPGLTANLQGFRIRAPEGWLLLQRRAPALVLRRCVRLGSHLGSDASRAPPGARQGLRAAGPATGNVPGARKGPNQLRTVDAPRSGQRSRRAALLHVRRPARAARPARP